MDREGREGGTEREGNQPARTLTGHRATCPSNLVALGKGNY